MIDPLLGQIMLWAPNFAPRGWLFCQGQSLPVNQNQALYAIIGNMYGGDYNNFKLPDLRGATLYGTKVGEIPGAIGGAATVSLKPENLPAHTHTAAAFSDPGNNNNPTGRLLANTGGTDPDYASTGTVVALAAGTVANAGSGQPVSVMQPYLAVNYIIAVQGIFPSRP